MDISKTGSFYDTRQVPEQASKTATTYTEQHSAALTVIEMAARLEPALATPAALTPIDQLAARADAIAHARTALCVLGLAPDRDPDAEVQVWAAAPAVHEALLYPLQ